MKNANTFATSLVLAIAALSAGSAMAGDAADTKLDIIGESPRQMFPANYGVPVAPGKTTAQVQAELAAVRRDAADTKLDMIGESPRQMFPAQNGVAVAAGKTREEVRAELVAARDSRDAADTVLDRIGQSPRQMFPANYPVKAKATAKVPAIVTTAAYDKLPIHTSL